MTRAGKYLTFRLGEKDFGIDVMKVRQILPIPAITPVPAVPAHLKGVMNLLGRIVPVVDMRMKFGFEDTPSTEQTCIVVVEVMQAVWGQAAELATLGLIVDSVSEVLNLTSADIEDPPQDGEKAEMPFVLGIARSKGAVKVLLKIEDALSLQELRGVQHIQNFEALVA